MVYLLHPLWKWSSIVGIMSCWALCHDAHYIHGKIYSYHPILSVLRGSVTRPHDLCICRSSTCNDIWHKTWEVHRYYPAEAQMIVLPLQSYSYLHLAGSYNLNTGVHIRSLHHRCLPLQRSEKNWLSKTICKFKIFGKIWHLLQNHLSTSLYIFWYIHIR